MAPHAVSDIRTTILFYYNGLGSSCYVASEGKKGNRIINVVPCSGEVSNVMVP